LNNASVVEKDNGLQSQKRWVKHPAACSIEKKNDLFWTKGINEEFYRKLATKFL